MKNRKNDKAFICLLAVTLLLSLVINTLYYYVTKRQAQVDPSYKWLWLIIIAQRILIAIIPLMLALGYIGRAIRPKATVIILGCYSFFTLNIMYLLLRLIGYIRSGRIYGFEHTAYIEWDNIYEYLYRSSLKRFWLDICLVLAFIALLSFLLIRARRNSTKKLNMQCATVGVICLSLQVLDNWKVFERLGTWLYSTFNAISPQYFLYGDHRAIKSLTEGTLIPFYALVLGVFAISGVYISIDDSMRNKKRCKGYYICAILAVGLASILPLMIDHGISGQIVIESGIRLFFTLVQLGSTLLICRWKMKMGDR